MKIADVMTKEVSSCSLANNLAEAARLMWEHDFGCVPIVSTDGKPVAMLTDRDVCMAAYTQGVPLRDISVSSAASKDVYSIRADKSTEAGEQLMKLRQVRRLPVVDEAGKLIGVVSLNDLARRATAPGQPRRDGPTAINIAETLGAICEHRVPGRAPRAA